LRLRSYELRQNDIVFSRVGSVDRNSLVRLAEDGWLFSGRLLRVRVSDQNVHPPYLSYHFHSEPFKQRVRTVAVGQTMASLNTQILKTIAIALPPPPEQRAIAAALADVDGLITALDRLIAKKRAIKQATMQQLLTGKTRLPGFGGAWEHYQIGNLGSFSKGRGIRRDDVSDDGVGCIRYGEIYTRYNNYVLSPFSRIPRSVAANALPIKHGDILFAGSGETAEEIGKCVAYLGTEEAYAGGDIVVLTPLNQNSLYLGHLLNHETVAVQKARMGQGDAVVHISAHNLAKIEIELPPIDEQAAIAAVLSDMDAEIAALEQRRAKTQAIKQGMMQQLLTGRIRLTNEEEPV
jgi:type I restriction enzyme S subunit